MNLLLSEAVKWLVREIKVRSLLNRCGMESASSLLSVSKPYIEGMYLLGKSAYVAKPAETLKQKKTLNGENGHGSCVSGSGLDK